MLHLRKGFTKTFLALQQQRLRLVVDELSSGNAVIIKEFRCTNVDHKQERESL